MTSGGSSAFNVVFSAKALRQFKALDPQDQKRLKEAIKKLEAFPPVTDVGKVKTRPGEYKLRAGNWRVFFRYNFAAREVEITAIRPRNHAYD